MSKNLIISLLILITVASIVFGISRNIVANRALEVAERYEKIAQENELRVQQAEREALIQSDMAMAARMEAEEQRLQAQKALEKILK